MNVLANHPEHHAVKVGWATVTAQLAELLHARNVHPTRTVVLLPYAQLMQEATRAWGDYEQSRGKPGAFVPHFETTMNWAAGKPGFSPAAQDIQLDAALDVLTAASLLQRAGLAEQQNLLSGRLVDAAWSLAQIAASQPPARRLAWGAAKALELHVGMESDALKLELAVAQIALAWAAASSYPTDLLFGDKVGTELDLLVVIDGFQSEPLAQALKNHFVGRAVSLKIETTGLPGVLGLHTAQDLQDEAHLAAACTLSHLQAGRSPVALIAQDRVLTRRVRAMLAEKGVALRDETGWKLSTTRAAATLMGLLTSLAWDASTDSVLDWLKNAPAFDALEVNMLEVTLRKMGFRYWRAVPLDQPETASIALRVAALRAALQGPRPLIEWLVALRDALQTAGQWADLAGDCAGLKVLAALHMDEGSGRLLLKNPRMSLQEFTAWVNQALEAASFAPAHPAIAQVVILPLSQLLGRPMQAVVLPGCDDMRLAVSPEPPGQWTPAQRALLGLPSRQDAADALRAAWQYALTSPHLDVLWRVSEGGERLMPSGFVQELLLGRSAPLAADPRPGRRVQLLATAQPLPTGQALPTPKLSASAYEDLRRCPYRFFALRQLKLQESDELESELGKRDFGNWLHLLLNRFHEALKAAPTQDIHAQAAMINIAADEATQILGLSAEDFLPFAAIWPCVRGGYLDWLAKHHGTGAVYEQGEVWKDMPLGKLTLVGKIDRIDRLPDGSRAVIDYKTEARGTTQERINGAGEDTQLAFYAALIEDDTLAAAYVNLGEKEPTKTYAQADIVDLRDDLIGAILEDMERIADGAPMPALGDGKACDYCAARGLCRKDFWS